MTLAYSLLHDDCIEILTDGAHYLPDGRVVEIASKVYRSPHVALVAVPIGLSEAGAIMARTIVDLSRCGSFDKTIKAAAKLISGLARLQIPEGGHFGILVAGISEAEGPRHLIAMTRTGGPGIEPFRLTDPISRDFGNIVGLTPPELAGVGITPMAAAGAGNRFLERHGAALGGIMRRKKQANFMRPELAPLHIIGGMLEHTRITAAGSLTQTLVVWDDEVGQQIDPVGRLEMAA